MSNEVIRKGEAVTLGLWLLSWLCRNKQEGWLTHKCITRVPSASGESWGLGWGLLDVGSASTGSVHAKEL